MEKAIAWRCGEIWFLKKGWYWTCPTGERLGYVYGDNAQQRMSRLSQIKKGEIK